MSIDPAGLIAESRAGGVTDASHAGRLQSGPNAEKENAPGVGLPGRWIHREVGLADLDVSDQAGNVGAEIRMRMTGVPRALSPAPAALNVGRAEELRVMVVSEAKGDVAT